jgi:hypothetical protein
MSARAVPYEVPAIKRNIASGWNRRLQIRMYDCVNQDLVYLPLYPLALPGPSKVWEQFLYFVQTVQT